MSALLAAAAGMLGVVALWDALAAIEGARLLAWLERSLEPARGAGRRGAPPSPGERRRLAFTAAVVPLCGGLLLAGPGGAVLCGAVGPAMAAAIVRTRRRRWRMRLAAGAPAAAGAIADALGAGHTTGAAVAVAARDGAVSGPVRDALGEVAAAIAVGMALDDALETLRRRAGPGPWDAIVAAILLQRSAGGDLARLLRDLSAGLVAAARIDAQARAASAQARLTARIVLALPVLGAVAVQVAAPGAIAAMLAQPLPRLLVVVAVVLQLVALVAVRRIARVDGA